MKVAVIGAGNIGGTLGTTWAKAGHEVRFGFRVVDDPENQKLVKDAGANARACSVDDAVEGADAVLFAIPGGAMAATLEKFGARLNGKVIMDATNNMGGAAMNSVAAIQKAAPGAHVFRAFNSVGWENFADSRYGDVHADLFYCGPDGAPQAAVETLISATGLRPVRVGGADKVAVVDGIASLWFALVFGEKRGRHLGFKMLTRS